MGGTFLDHPVPADNQMRPSVSEHPEGWPGAVAARRQLHH